VLWLTRRSDDELADMARRGKEWVAENRSYARIADDFERACQDSRDRAPMRTISA
jgi:hypothetical protein